MVNNIKKLSRRQTNKIVTGSWGMQKYEIENKFCNKCGKTEDLEVHHEIYPTRAYEIKMAIFKGKIYLVCKTCHKEIHTQNKKI